MIRAQWALIQLSARQWACRICHETVRIVPWEGRSFRWLCGAMYRSRPISAFLIQTSSCIPFIANIWKKCAFNIEFIGISIWSLWQIMKGFQNKQSGWHFKNREIPAMCRSVRRAPLRYDMRIKKVETTGGTIEAQYKICIPLLAFETCRAALTAIRIFVTAQLVPTQTKKARFATVCFTFQYVWHFAQKG